NLRPGINGYVTLFRENPHFRARPLPAGGSAAVFLRGMDFVKFLRAALLMLLGSSIVAPAAAGSFASEFPARILAAHNAQRAQMGMPPLAWDAELGNEVAAYAQQMSVTGMVQHSNRQAPRG